MIGTRPIRSLAIFVVSFNISGSPGPGESMIPSGFRLNNSSAVVSYGNTVTLHPLASRILRMLYLTP